MGQLGLKQTVPGLGRGTEVGGEVGSSLKVFDPLGDLISQVLGDEKAVPGEGDGGLEELRPG